MQLLYKVWSSRNCFLMITGLRNYANQPYPLYHDKKKGIFYMQLGVNSGQVAYRKDGEVLDLFHSYVPKPLRGRGLGIILADTVFQYVNDNNLKMKLTCQFLKTRFEKVKSNYRKDILQQ